MLVRVPATSANIGPGYDSFGMAFNIYNEFEFKLGKLKESSLISKSFKFYFKELGLDCPEVDISGVSEVPRSRGLGSSATCIVAGLMAANEYNGSKLDKYELLKLATELEGHPDNVAAAIFGGHTIAFGDTVVKVEVSEKLKFYALVPNFEMSTEVSRTLVAKTLSTGEAVQNIAGAAMITNALRLGDFELLKSAPEDTIHQQKRFENIDEYESVKEIFNGENSKLFLSGSGSTILLVGKAETDFSKEFKKLSKLKNNWKVFDCEVDNEGAKVYGTF